MVWSKILTGIGLSLLGLLIPLFVEIYYVYYIGVALRFSALILVLQGIRTLRSYKWLSKELVTQSNYSRNDISNISSFIDQEIVKNTLEQKLAIGGVILSVIISVGGILSWAEVAMFSSFIPIVLVLGIEFCFILILIYIQNEYKYWLEKES